MELDLTGKVALVTGSTRGIGRAISEALIAEGCSVVVNSRDDDDLPSCAEELNAAAFIAGDVTDPQDAARIVGRVLEDLGKLDILVCNVGSGRSVPPGEENYDEWQRVFARNLWSTTNMVEAAQAALADSSGVVVCVSSICGLEVIPGAPVSYSAAKAALHSYVRGIARPLGKMGVRINAVAPGNILFDGSVWSRKLKEDPDSVQAMLERDVALERLGDPGEVADLVTFLASERAGFATGGVWTLDGGQVHS